MAVSVTLTPGRTIRWRKRRFVVVDSTGFDAIVAREVGKRRLARIPVSEARPNHATGRRAASATDLVSVDEDEWRTAVKRFSILKALFEMDKAQRTRSHVEKVARILDRHPATIYRWIAAHDHSERVSVLLRKGRSDQGGSRLSKEVDAIIEAAIKKIYLVAEQPDRTIRFSHTLFDVLPFPLGMGQSCRYAATAITIRASCQWTAQRADKE